LTAGVGGGAAEHVITELTHEANAGNIVVPARSPP
jgi:hypothetical protein